jgi:hypothetical protein
VGARSASESVERLREPSNGIHFASTLYPAPTPRTSPPTVSRIYNQLAPATAVTAPGP